MSLLKKLKKVGKKAGKKIEGEAKKRIEEYQLKKQKAELLDDLGKKELIELCFKYDVPVSRKWEKKRVIKNLVDYEELSLNDISKYVESTFADESKIMRVSRREDYDVEQEIIRTEKIKTRVRKRKVNRFESTLRKQLKSFNPIIRKRTREKNIEEQLVQRLQAVLGDDKVNYQERARAGRVDIVVDKKYAIELKMITSPSQLTSLLGQTLVYSKEYPKLFLWLYDVKKSLKTADINNFKKNLQSAKIKNFEVIVKP